MSASYVAAVLLAVVCVVQQVALLRAYWMLDSWTGKAPRRQRKALLRGAFGYGLAAACFASAWSTHVVHGQEGNVIVGISLAFGLALVMITSGFLDWLMED